MTLRRPGQNLAVQENHELWINRNIAATPRAVGYGGNDFAVDQLHHRRIGRRDFDIAATSAGGAWGGGGRDLRRDRAVPHRESVKRGDIDAAGIRLTGAAGSESPSATGTKDTLWPKKGRPTRANRATRFARPDQRLSKVILHARGAASVSYLPSLTGVLANLTLILCALTYIVLYLQRNHYPWGYSDYCLE